MKSIYKILFAVCLLIPTGNTWAQNISGIRVESNSPIEVFVNGTRVSNLVYSCMITNLKRGNYTIEAFGYNDDFNGIKQLLYREIIHFNGIGIREVFVNKATCSSHNNAHNTIHIDEHINNGFDIHTGHQINQHKNINCHEDQYDRNLQLIDEATFEQLLSSLENAHFSTDKKNIIEMASKRYLFLTSHVKEICETYTFDKDKLWLLKLMYPSIFDYEKAFLLTDMLTFSTSKEEFKKFVEIR